MNLSLLAIPTNDTKVVLSGQEQANGVDPTTTTISFSGVINGQVTPDAKGNFSYIATGSALGEVDAVATDPAGDMSNQAAAQIDNRAGWGLTLTATPKQGTMVLLTGQVTAPDPTQTKITIGGVMSATITPNADGTFAYTGPASQLGTVNAVLTNSGGNVQAISQALVQSTEPVITNLAVEIVCQTNVFITGTVVAPNPGGLVVNFAGALGGTTTTNPDGTFSLATTASRLGVIMAQVTDGWGQISTTATVTLTSPPPSFQSFFGSQQYSTTWVLTGQVAANPNSNGWTVSMTGVPGYQTISAVVGSNGAFSAGIGLSNPTNVFVTATVTDWWGQQATAVAVLG